MREVGKYLAAAAILFALSVQAGLFFWAGGGAEMFGGQAQQADQKPPQPSPES